MHSLSYKENKIYFTTFVSRLQNEAVDSQVNELPGIEGKGGGYQKQGLLNIY